MGHYARNCRKKKGPQRYMCNDISGSQTPSEQKSSSDSHGAFIVTKVENEIMNADSRDIWLLDSGASKYMSFQRSWFNNFVEINESVCLGDNSTCKVKGRGTIHIQKYVNGTWTDGRIDNVLYVPDLKKNLLSMGVITQKGYDLRLS